MKPKRKEDTLEDQIYRETYPIVTSYWGKVPILCKVRELSASQLWSLGAISLIETFEDKLAKQQVPTVTELLAYAERHHKILKMALVYPKYDDLLTLAGSHISQAEVDQRLEKIKSQWLALPPGKEKNLLEDQYNSLELCCRFILPPEFTAPLIAYLTGADRTEIKTITEETLYQAAVLASRGGDNPSDHVSGQFERFPGDRFLLEDINNRAWIIFDERRSKKG